MLGLRNYLKSKKKREAELISFQDSKKVHEAVNYIKLGMNPEKVKFALDLTREELEEAQKRAAAV